MSGTPTRLTMRSGRLRSSIVSANDPLVTAAISLKPAWPSAACRTPRALRSGSISSTRGIASDPRPDRGRQGFDELDEAGLVDRLGDVVLHAELAREIHMLGARAGGQHHDRQVPRRRLPVQVADQLVAVEARHLQICDNDVDGVLAELLQRLGAVPRNDDAKARPLEHAAHELPDADRVVHEQDAAPAVGSGGAEHAALAARVAGPGRRRGHAHLEELQGVEQQDDMPLAGYRGSGERADALQEGAEVLDDDL